MTTHESGPGFDGAPDPIAADVNFINVMYRFAGSLGYPNREALVEATRSDPELRAHVWRMEEQVAAQLDPNTGRFHDLPADATVQQLYARTIRCQLGLSIASWRSMPAHTRDRHLARLGLTERGLVVLMDQLQHDYDTSTAGRLLDFGQ